MNGRIRSGAILLFLIPGSVLAQPTEVNDLSLDQWLTQLRPPAAEVLIEALQPIPTMEDLLESGSQVQQPPLRAFTEELEEFAMELRAEIDRFWQMNHFAEAEEAAQELAELCEEELGDDHWRSLNARRRLEKLRLLGDNPDLQEAFLEGQRHNVRVKPLLDEARYQQALDAAWSYLQALLVCFGQNDAESSTGINNVATALNHMGRLGEADVLLRQSLGLKLEAYGVLHPSTAATIHNLGDVLQELGRLEEAELCYRKTDSLYQILAPQSPPTRALNGLARVLVKMEQAVSARLVAQECLRRDLAVPRPSPLEAAQSLHSLALAQSSLGEYSKAEASCRKALEIRQEFLGSEHPDIALTLNTLATILARQGAFAEAQQNLEAALRIDLEKLGALHPTTATDEHNLAFVLCERGKLQEAIQLLEQSLATRAALQPGDHLGFFSSLSLLAKIRFGQGDLARAESLFRQVLALTEEKFGDKHPSVGLPLSNLAMVMQEKGDYGEAERLLRRAITSLRASDGSRPHILATALHNLSSCLRKSPGEMAESEALRREALSIRERLLNPGHPSLTSSQNSLASVRFQQGLVEEAEQILRENLATSGRNVEAAISHISLSVILKSQERYAEAERECLQALKILDSWSGDERTRAEALGHLGRLRRVQGDLDGAADLFREALAIVETLRPKVIADERQRATYSRELSLAGLSKELTNTLVQTSSFDEAVSVVEQGSSRALLDLLARSDQDLAELATQEGQSGFQEALSLEAEARSRLIEGENQLAALRLRTDLEDRKTKLVAASEARLQEFRVQAKEAETQVLAAFQEVWPQASPMTVQQIREGLEPGELLLLYSWTEYAVGLLVVSSQAGPSTHGGLILEGKQQVRALGLQLGDLRKSIETGEEAKGLEQRLESLRQVLVPAWAWERLVGIDRLAFVPDGPLYALPFQLLLDAGREPPRRGSRVSDTPDVVHAGSATLHLRCRERARHRTERLPKARVACILGDPQYNRLGGGVPAGGEEEPVGDDPMGEAAAAGISALNRLRLYGHSLPRLPHTDLEARAIDQLFLSRKVATRLLLRENAAVPDLERVVAKVSFLHLAAHGLVGTRDRPFDACLALAQPAEPTLDNLGFLSLDHLLYRWRGSLQECELVVLSACDSQRGIEVGDSVMALPWGFLYAGASAIVASLWQVDDAATALLMKRFYENLLGCFQARSYGGRHYARGQGLSKAAALREAQQWLRSRSPEQNQMNLKSMEEQAAARGEQVFFLVPTQEKPCDYSHPRYWAAFVLLGDASACRLGPSD